MTDCLVTRLGLALTNALMKVKISKHSNPIKFSNYKFVCISTQKSPLLVQMDPKSPSSRGMSMTKISSRNSVQNFGLMMTVIVMAMMTMTMMMMTIVGCAGSPFLIPSLYLAFAHPQSPGYFQHKFLS